MKLMSIAKEAAACRAAWAAVPDATAGVHIHHETPAEKLTEPIANRIAYILSRKPKKEQALRLRLMRPITAEQRAEYRRATAPARAEYQRAEAPARAEYQRATAPAWAEYRRATAPARAEYQRAEAPAWAEYQRVRAPARAEYQRAEAPARAEYQRVIKAAHDTICPTTDCPFDGKSIF